MATLPLLFEAGSPAWFEREGAPATVVYFRRCNRCGGAGRSDRWAFTGFVCFDCGGAGGRNAERKVYSAAKLAKLNATRDKAQAKAQAKRDAIVAERKAVAAAALVEFEAAHSELIASARNHAENTLLANVVADCERKAVEVNEHIGTVGERREFSGVCLYVGEFTSFYGPFYIATIRTERGIVAYKGSACPFTKGETCRFKATVKAHESYKGTPQTIIARPAVAQIEVA
jgi:hypothetical protein